MKNLTEMIQNIYDMAGENNPLDTREESVSQIEQDLENIYGINFLINELKRIYVNIGKDKATRELINTALNRLEYLKKQGNKKTTYIVKVCEEQLGFLYFQVTVPLETDVDEVYKNLNMAKKYINVQNSDNKAEYDKHFEDMLKYREDNIGINTFSYYLKNYCGYNVKEVSEFDFCLEW